MMSFYGMSQNSECVDEPKFECLGEPNVWMSQNFECVDEPEV